VLQLAEGNRKHYPVKKVGSIFFGNVLWTKLTKWKFTLGAPFSAFAALIKSLVGEYWK
jgi:hypothetical protein